MKLHTLLLVAVGCALSACGGSPQPVGLGQTQPGQSPVVSQAPLSVPPDFNLPPASAAPQPQQGTLAAAVPDTTLSSGEQALLQTAGAENPDPNIRKIVDQEATTGAAPSQDLTDKLAFWQSSALQPAAGTAPTIKRKSAGMLDGIF